MDAKTDDTYGPEMMSIPVSGLIDIINTLERAVKPKVEFTNDFQLMREEARTQTIKEVHAALHELKAYVSTRRMDG